MTTVIGGKTFNYILNKYYMSL